MNCWLVKQEPSTYSWDDFVVEGSTAWTGVRNHQARNFLAKMSTGDRVLFYHSVRGKCVVGEAEVIRPAYPDPTASEGDNWVCVDLQPVRAFPSPVTLEQIKAEPSLKDIPLLRQSRLSVMPLTLKMFRSISRLGDQKA